MSNHHRSPQPRPEPRSHPARTAPTATATLGHATETATPTRATVRTGAALVLPSGSVTRADLRRATGTTGLCPGGTAGIATRVTRETGPRPGTTTATGVTRATSGPTTATRATRASATTGLIRGIASIATHGGSATRGPCREATRASIPATALCLIPANPAPSAGRGGVRCRPNRTDCRLAPRRRARMCLCQGGARLPRERGRGNGAVQGSAIGTGGMAEVWAVEADQLHPQPVWLEEEEEAAAGAHWTRSTGARSTQPMGRVGPC